MGEATYGGGREDAPLAGSPACVFVFVFVLIYVEFEFSQSASRPPARKKSARRPPKRKKSPRRPPTRKKLRLTQKFLLAETILKGR